MILGLDQNDVKVHIFESVRDHGEESISNFDWQYFQGALTLSHYQELHYREYLELVSNYPSQHILGDL